MSKRNVFKALPAADGGNINANESTKAVDVSRASQVNFGASGAFGGGTLTIEGSLDHGATWVSTGQTLAAAGAKVITAPFTQLRGTMAGAAGPNVACAVGVQYDE